LKANICSPVHPFRFGRKHQASGKREQLARAQHHAALGSVKVRAGTPVVTLGRKVNTVCCVGESMKTFRGGLEKSGQGYSRFAEHYFVSAA